jgi:1-acyl-sn-glycerol-3-phosphate acyltransferase
MKWFLGRVYQTAGSRLGVRVEVEEPELTAGEQAARLARPVIVLSRHAGPGDSFLLVHHLLSAYGRRPRVVMKASLQLDPCLDVVANRLPNVFVSARRTGARVFTEQIQRLARGLDQTGALVLFPEGGNWTPARWHRGIRRLERQDRGDLAARARQMPNLLPPRAGGALAAIAACPEADVIFVAHAGLEHLISAADVWRRLPMNGVIRAKWWRVSSADVPRAAGHDTQTRWLYDWWGLIDGWISAALAAGTRDQPAATAAAAAEDVRPAGPRTPA